MLDWRELSDNHLMRWVLSAHNICYSNRLYAAFFSYGKSIPVVRGAGIRQQGMQFCVDRLAGGQWAHIYPEGKVTYISSSFKFVYVLSQQLFLAVRLCY